MITEITAADLALENKDMHTTAGTDYTSGVIDLSDYSEILVDLTFDSTGTPSAGLGRVYCQRVDKDDANVGPEIALISAVDIESDGNAQFLLYGDADAVATGGTVGTAADTIRPLGRCKLLLNVEEEHNGDACTASVRILCK